MSQPSIIYDGQLGTITQDGPGWFTMPFQSKGDTQSWEYHINCTQLAKDYVGLKNVSSYVSPVFGGELPPPIERMQTISTERGTGYLVDESEPQEMNRTGWLRFRRTYAGLPVTRFEGEEASYTIQFLTGFFKLLQYSIPIKAFWKYEYFLQQWPGALIAPRILLQDLSVIYIPFKSVTADDGGWPPTYTKPFIAQDSELSIYKGGITQRKTLYGIFPTQQKVSFR